MKIQRIKKMTTFFAAVLMVLLVLQTITVQAAQADPVIKENDLYARAAVLMDAESGRILYGKNQSQAMANASTTKILTCILALEETDPENTQVTVSAYAQAQPKVHLGMVKGEVYRMIDLLYALMLESYNDCAVAIAEHIGGDVKGFADLMNAKAKEIGCKNTYFITPNGLDAKDETGFHHTTAEELARIMRYCVLESEKAEEFLEITRTRTYEFTSGSRTFHCNNHNAMLDRLEGILSGKTGFTGNAGYCYVCAFENEGRKYIVTLLACGWPNNRTYKWKDTEKLLSYGMEQFEKKVLDESWMQGRKLEEIPVENGQTKAYGQQAYALPEIEKKTSYRSVLLKKSEQITIVYEMPEKIQAPVLKDRQIGKIYYKAGKEILESYQVKSSQTIQKKNIKWYINQTILNWIL